MEWYVILALVLGISVILFPLAYVWYMNVGGIYQAIQEARKRRAIHEEKIEAAAPVTVATPRIREVQVFSKAGERVTTEAIGHETSPAKEEAREQQKAGVRQIKQ